MNINNIHTKKLVYCKTILFLHETRRIHMIRIITTTPSRTRTTLMKTRVTIIWVGNNYKVIA